MTLNALKRAGVFASFAVLAGCAGPATTAPDLVDLSGTWTLVGEHGDEWARATEAIVSSRQSEPNRKPGRHDRKSEPADEVVASLDFISPQSRTLRIDQFADSLRIVFGDGRQKRYRFGEESVLSVAVGNGKQVAGWDGDGFVIETTLDSGLTITEQLRRSGGSGHLIRQVTIDLRRRREPLVIEQSYAPGPAQTRASAFSQHLVR